MRFYRILCGLGHRGDVLSEGSPIPTKCPICNQPYDRRRLNRILCNEDGTELVEEGLQEEPRQSAEDIVPEYTKREDTERIVPMYTKREGIAHIDPTYTQGVDTERSAPIYTRRESRPEVSYERENSVRRRAGMQNDFPQGESHDTGDMHHRARRRMENDVINETNIEPKKEPSRFENHGRRIITYENDTKKYCVYCSGMKLSIPSQGIYLGRGEYGAECIGMNSLVSRRHAYLEDHGFGELFIKDADSLNGTYVDDGDGRRRLIQGENVKLHPGDKFWLADQLFVVDEE